MEREEGAHSLMQALRDRMALRLVERERSDIAAERSLAAAKRVWLHGADKVLQEGTLRRALVEMQYAVRGLVPATAERIQKELAAGGHDRPFDEILWANIGNPHAVGQMPITYYREVGRGG